MRVKCFVTERYSGLEWSTASTLWRAHSNYLSPLAELHYCQLERYKPSSLILHALSTFKETNQARSFITLLSLRAYFIPRAQSIGSKPKS